jgi:hypothetical protein
MIGLLRIFQIFSIALLYIFLYGINGIWRKAMDGTITKALRGKLLTTKSGIGYLKH